MSRSHVVLGDLKSPFTTYFFTQIPGNICFPYVAAHTDGFADVDEEYILKGMKLLLSEGKLLCEPSSGISIGAVLQGLIPVKPEDKICFFISGGSVSLKQLHQFVPGRSSLKGTRSVSQNWIVSSSVSMRTMWRPGSVMTASP